VNNPKLRKSINYQFTA